MASSRKPRNIKPKPPPPPPSHASSKRNRCGTCSGCLAPECGSCHECSGKARFGGDGSSHQACINRRCLSIHGDTADNVNKNSNSANDISASLGWRAMSNGAIEMLPAPSLLDDSRPKKKKKSDDGDKPECDTMYGQKIVDDPGDMLCAGCLQPQDSINDDVLLCDGPGCGREYHTQCCDPPVEEIPKGNWYCQDCTVEGTTQLLRRYLETIDEQRNAYESSQEFVTSLVGQDMEDYRRYRENQGEKRIPIRRPISELLRSEELHALINDTRRDEEGVDKTHPSHYWEFVGSPVRLYDRLSNQYHSGRLVDLRRSRPCGAVEFLVRFPAGKDGRKTLLMHWIVLEEHAIAIESKLVWTKHGDIFVPGQHYLRSARELVYVQDMYSESSGEIQFSDPVASATAVHKQKWGLIRLFGPEEFVLSDLTKVHPYDGGTEHVRRARTPGVEALVGLAEVERSEQESTRQWKNLEQDQKWGPQALSSADQHTLQPLLLEKRTAEFPSHLVPSIPLGLDRLYILNQLKKQGVEVTRSAGAALECCEVPIQLARCQYELEGN